MTYATRCSVAAQEQWTNVSTEEGEDHPSSLCLPTGRTPGTADSIVVMSGDPEESRGLGPEELDEGSAQYWGSTKGSEAAGGDSSFFTGPEALAELGISYSVLYPTLEPHPYSVKEVHLWSRRMLTLEEFRILKSAAFRLEADSLPKSELTGLYFNKHRPCWSVDYYSRQRKRKTIDFFVPDVKHSTLALVLKCASACRLVLPRRFEDVPAWIPEPDESTGGLPYRAGAKALAPAVLRWVLLNRPRNDMAYSCSEAKRVHPRANRDVRGKVGASAFEFSQKPALSVPLAISPSLTCDSCSDSKVGTSSPLVTPEAQSPVHGGGTSYQGGPEEFIYLPERLIANDQQKHQQKKQLAQAASGCPSQQFPATACLFDSSSPVFPTQLQLEETEVLQPQPDCYGVTKALPPQEQQPLPQAGHAGRTAADWGNQSSVKDCTGDLAQVRSVVSSPASFRQGKVSSSSRCGALSEPLRKKRPLEREHKEVRCIRRPAVLPIPVPRLDEKLLTASEKLEPSVGAHDLLWGGVLGTQTLVSLSNHWPHASCSTNGGVGCWGQPIDMLRDWYRAAEGEGVGISVNDIATAESTTSSTDFVSLPFHVTPEDLAAAAELASRPYTPTDAAG
ncbi:hypothetical protein Efla_003322 [Eimeria flavescens]